MTIGHNLDASMDEIRMRKKSGFPGVPTARYNAEEGTWLLYQFDNQSTTQITDNSGQNNPGTIYGTAAYEDDVYASGGGGGGLAEASTAADAPSPGGTTPPLDDGAADKWRRRATQQCHENV